MNILKSRRSTPKIQNFTPKNEGYKSANLDSLNELLNSCKTPKAPCEDRNKSNVWTRSYTLSSLDSPVKKPKTAVNADSHFDDKLKARKHPLSLATLKGKSSEAPIGFSSTRNYENKEPMSARSVKTTCIDDELFTNDTVGFLNVNQKCPLFQFMTNQLDGKESTRNIKLKPQASLNVKILQKMGSLKPITENEPKKERAGTMVFTELWAPKKKKVVRNLVIKQSEKIKESDCSYPSINDTSLDQNKIKKSIQDIGSQLSTKSELSLPSLSIVNRKKSHSETKKPLQALKSFTERKYSKLEN